MFVCMFKIHTIAIIAEGIPEAQTRKLIKVADEKGVTIIGPATVCFYYLSHQQLCNYSIFVCFDVVDFFKIIYIL